MGLQLLILIFIVEVTNIYLTHLLLTLKNAIIIKYEQ